MENFLVGKKKGGLSNPALAPKAAEWDLMQATMPWVLPHPCKRDVQPHWDTFFPGHIPDLWGQMSEKLPIFFSCFIWFNLALVMWTWWLTRAPRGWSWGSGEQPHLGEAQTHFLGNNAYLKKSQNHSFRQEDQLWDSSFEFSCTEPLLTVVIEDCRPLPGTCAKNPAKSKYVKV